MKPRRRLPAPFGCPLQAVLKWRGCLNGCRYLNWGADRGHLTRRRLWPKESPPPDSKWLVCVASLPWIDPRPGCGCCARSNPWVCGCWREGGLLAAGTTRCNRQGLLRLSAAHEAGSPVGAYPAGDEFDAEQGRAVRSLFDGGKNYEELIKAVNGLPRRLGNLRTQCRSPEFSQAAA